MSKTLEKVLPELVAEGIIDDGTAQRINDYIKNKPGKGGNRLLIVFGILGALLVGLGIILIIAHNWDDLSKTTKTALSFLPLVAGQLAVIYALTKQKGDAAWQEASATFLFLACGATISLVAQVYNIYGDLNSFIITWTLLGLPLIYLLPSTMSFLLYIIGVTVYGCNAEYINFNHIEKYWHWLLLAGALPYYLKLYKEQRDSNFFTFASWFLAVSCITLLGTIGHYPEDFIYVAYFSLFACFTIIGTNSVFLERRRVNNPWLTLGSLGTVVLLITLSFKSFWYRLPADHLTISVKEPEFVVAILLTLLAALLLYTSGKLRQIKTGNFDYIHLVFVAFFLLFMIGTSSYFLALLLDNVLVFLLGVYYIRKGAGINHLGILNYGLLILATLITCRYFDSDMSFLVRGILFVGVGTGFFVANYQLLKKRKQSSQS